MTPETESCQLTDPEVLGALYLAGVSVSGESPFNSLVKGSAPAPPPEHVQASLMRKGLLTGPTSVTRNWVDVLQVLAQPLWSTAVVLGAHEGFSFYEYFCGGSLRVPRLVCHRADDEGTHHISYYYSLDTLLAQLSETVDIDGPVTSNMRGGDFSPKEFMVASTLLDVYRTRYFRALLSRSSNTQLEFTADDFMAVFNDGLHSDDTRWLVTLCNASLPFDYKLDLDEVADQLHTMASRGWVEVISEQARQYRISDTLAQMGRVLLLPTSFAAFKVEQMLDGRGQEPRSLSVVRTPQSLWLVECKTDSGPPVRVSLNSANGAELQSMLQQIVEECERRTPSLVGRVTAPQAPRPTPAPPAPPDSAPTVLPAMPASYHGSPPMEPWGAPPSPSGAPPPAPSPASPAASNGPALLRRRPDGASIVSASGADDPYSTPSGSTYGVPDNGRPVQTSSSPAGLSEEVQCVHCGQMVNRNKKFCRGCGGATADSLWSASPTDSSGGRGMPGSVAWGGSAFGAVAPAPAPPSAGFGGSPAVPPAPAPPSFGEMRAPAAPGWGSSPPSPPAGAPSAWGTPVPPAPAGGPTEVSNWSSAPPVAAPGGFPPSIGGTPTIAPNIPPNVPFGTSPPAYGSGFAPMPPTTPPPVPVPAAPGPPPTPSAPPVAAVPPPAPAASGPAGMIPCPVCQGLVNEKARFCGHCGTNITMQRTDTSGAGPAPASPERTCTGCGFKASKPATFCPNCGSRFG